MSPDLWALYELMLKSRLFEEAVAKLWHEGKISGEMHLGTGEEAINAGVVAHLREGDAMALDHRGTGALLMRGEEPGLILRELLGKPDGLCGGMGGHMHLFSQRFLTASSGIVGASGPAAAGFGLAAQYLRPGAVAVAFFGDGTLNQGMLMESLVLSSAWNLPVIFVCKDDGWAITTRSAELTGGDIGARAAGFGMPVIEVDGSDVSAVWEVSRSAIGRARANKGPSFIHARCVHVEGHFLGLQLIRAIREPIKEIPKLAVPIARSLLTPGGSSLSERMEGLNEVLKALRTTLQDPRRDTANDPIRRTRQFLLSEARRLRKLEDTIEEQLGRDIASAVGDA